MAPTSTREATNKSFKPSFKDNAMISPTPPTMQATPVMHYGKRAVKSHAHNVASPYILIGSSDSSSQQLSKSPAKAQAATSSTPLTEIFRKQLEQASQHGSPDSSGDNSQLAPQDSQALQEQVKKPKLDHRRTTLSSTEEHPRPTPRRLTWTYRNKAPRPPQLLWP